MIICDHSLCCHFSSTIINKKIIQCDRCGYNFTTIANLRKHLNKKNTCEPILKDIALAELKDKYKVIKGCYKCENCGKEFKTSSGKCKHKKKCLINPIIIEKKENDKLKEELDKEISKRKELEKQVEQLLLEKTPRNQEKHIGVIKMEIFYIPVNISFAIMMIVIQNK